MIVDRLKNILKANINSSWEKLSDNDFDLWKSYFGEDEKGSDFYKEEKFKADEEAWERQKREQQQYQQPYKDPQQELLKKENQYYADLELKPGASFDEVKKGYRRMVKLYHPDLFQHNPKKQELAKEVTRKINEAYGYFEKKFGK